MYPVKTIFLLHISELCEGKSIPRYSKQKSYRYVPTHSTLYCIHVHYSFALNNKFRWKLCLFYIWQIGVSWETAKSLNYVNFFHIECENMILFLFLKTQNPSQA